MCAHVSWNCSKYSHFWVIKSHPFLYSWGGREDILILAVRYFVSARFLFVIRWDNKENMETLILFVTLNSLTSHCGPAVNWMLRLHRWPGEWCFWDGHCLAEAPLHSPQEYRENNGLQERVSPQWLSWAGKLPERGENGTSFPTCHWIEYV